MSILDDSEYWREKFADVHVENQALQEKVKRYEWIDVNERLPEEYQEVLGYKQGVGFVLVRPVPEGWVETWDDGAIFDIKYWSYLPEPPDRSE